jgi:hypothetical protein
MPCEQFGVRSGDQSRLFRHAWIVVVPQGYFPRGSALNDLAVASRRISRLLALEIAK